MTTTPQLHLLTLRCQTGDESALTALVTLYTPRLRVFLQPLARPGHLDDLLQDIWFDVYRALPKLRSPDAFTPWLYRIARDRACRDLRRRPPPVTLPDLPLAQPEPDDPFTPEDAAQLRTALDALPSHHRDILVLRFLEDLSYDQLAAILALPVGTIRSRLHYAKLALREEFERTSCTKDHP